MKSLTSCTYDIARVVFKVVRRHSARCSAELLTHYQDNRTKVRVVDNQKVLSWTQEATTHLLGR